MNQQYDRIIQDIIASQADHTNCRPLLLQNFFQKDALFMF